MNPRHPAAALGLILSLAACATAAAQSPALDDTARRAMVDSLARALVARYVFPEVGERLAAELRKRTQDGEYDQLTPSDLASRITGDLYAIAHDGHLRVLRRPEGGVLPGGGDPAAQAAFARSVNYGIARVEVLPGNVGLLELRGFLPVGSVREALLDAMRKLGKVDALIIDLRRNGGGEPETVALLSSMLFPRGQRVHLNDLHWREGNRVDHYYTDPDLDVPRISGPVYVLTSRRTFSAAEEFTYNLKQLKRATQVGETSGGGANPGEGVPLPAGFDVFLPTGRAENPISHDNWEGKGCVPEVPTSAEDALATAHRLALEKLGRSGT
ncbi:MAG TPA: S41 family peptidase [Gemmatimonadales bacterium]|nr:S41 family peptidase [Gemmatimonadales bacterium]